MFAIIHPVVGFVVNITENHQAVVGFMEIVGIVVLRCAIALLPVNADLGESARGGNERKSENKD